MSKKLFRDQALEAQKSKWIGEVILIRPFSFTILTLFVVIFTLILLAFIFLGSYTKRTTVQGLLMPNTGVIRVYSSEGGTVSRKYVKDGELVKTGQPLFALKMTRYSSSGNYNESINQQIQLKKLSLDTEKNKIKDLHSNNQQQLTSEIQSLNLEINTLNSLIQEQKQRVNLAQENVNRYRELRDKDYISVEEYQLKQDAFMSQKLNLQSYERDKISKEAELANKRLVLQSLNSKLDNDLGLVDRQMASTQQESIENKARDGLILKANANGRIASSSAEVGQFIAANLPIMSIVPEPSYLQAYLLVPSHAIGFIQVGQQVKLRFQAYPYQKFGQGVGEVISISENTLNPQDLVNLGEFGQNISAEQNQPVYLVKVKLSQQTVKAYGENKALKVGMAFDADVMQEKRKLYEWVLEPLYSISGKL